MDGACQTGPEHLALAGAQGAVMLPDRAARANTVLMSSAAPVKLRLDLNLPGRVTATQDDALLDSQSAGAGVIGVGSQSRVIADAPRMRALTRDLTASVHELRPDVPARSLTILVFSVTTCAQPAAGP